MYSCVPESAPARFWYSRLAWIDVACSAVRAYRRTRSSNVPFVSSMTAYSSPGQSPSTGAGVFGNESTPSASASRRAGSTVTTHARRPVRAACSANVAATVVFPTPPGPQQTTTGRSAARDVRPPAGPGATGPGAVGPGADAPAVSGAVEPVI